MVAALLAGCGFVLLLTGGEALVRGSAGLASRFGLSPLFVGLTVVAFGTSSPEFTVSVGAALNGFDGIALGNVIGSNIANIGLILGLGALLRPLQAERGLVRFDVPVLVASGLLASFFLLDHGIGRREGAILCAGLLGYIAVAWRRASDGRARIDPEWGQGLTGCPSSAARCTLEIVLGLALLVVGGRLLVDGAVQIARALDVAEALIGLTVVAVGTSLPELVTTVVAVRRGETELAVGNVVGSNIFNTLGVLGAAALIHPVATPDLPVLDLWVMSGLGVALLIFAATRNVVDRYEGALLIGAYGVFATLIFVT